MLRQGIDCTCYDCGYVLDGIEYEGASFDKETGEVLITYTLRDHDLEEVTVTVSVPVIDLIDVINTYQVKEWLKKHKERVERAISALK